MIAFLPYFINAQVGLVEYTVNPSDEAFIVQDSLFVPVEKNKKTLYHVFPFGENNLARVFDPKTDDRILCRPLKDRKRLQGDQT